MKYYILQSVEADTLEEAIEKIAQGGLDKDAFDVKLQTKKELLANFHESNDIVGVLDVDHDDSILEEVVKIGSEPAYLDSEFEEHLFSASIDTDQDIPLLRKILDDCKENDCAYFRLITR